MKSRNYLRDTFFDNLFSKLYNSEASPLKYAGGIFLTLWKIFCNRFGLRMFRLNFSFSFLNFSFSRKSSEALLIDYDFSRLLILFISKYISNSALFFGLPFFTLIEWNSILSAWSSVKLKSFKNCLISLMFKKTLAQSWHNGTLFINLTYKEFNKSQREDL